MKNFCILIVSLFLVNGAMGQPKKPCVSCLPQGITFSTQADIDNFQTNYPGCEEIEGVVNIISGNSILSLDGLSVLTAIGSDLRIQGNNVLVYTSGLQNITVVGGNLWITNNKVIGSLAGFVNLQAIGGSLKISSNFYLSNLEGLENVNEESITDLTITENSNLSSCAIESICSYLLSPSGTIEIHDNLTGCNSQQEVEDDCLAIGAASLTPESSLTIYPNPASTTLTIEATDKGTLSIHNIRGHQNLQQTTTQPATAVDVSDLKSGVYLVKVIGERGVSVGKFIKQ